MPVLMLILCNPCFIACYLGEQGLVRVEEGPAGLDEADIVVVHKVRHTALLSIHSPKQEAQGQTKQKKTTVCVIRMGEYPAVDIH